jgi:nitrate/nitrite transporter NarK
MRSSRPNPWRMLGVGIGAQFAGTFTVYAPVFLIPHLHLEQGLSLPAATLVAAMPRFGSLLTIFLWGIVVDCYGERLSIGAGFLLASLAGVGALVASDTRTLGAALFVAGIGASCVNSASARVVAAWFPPERRGLAMGIRQGSQPIGVAAAAAFVPLLASSYGTQAALAVPLAVCVLTVVLGFALVVDPPRLDRAAEPDLSRLRSPYVGSRRLLRIHLSSALLMFPQITIWNFSVLWLIEQQSWSPGHAGALVAACQLGGAAVRAGMGLVSDRVASRLWPMRLVAFASAAAMVALGSLQTTTLAVSALVVASLITVADNGLGVTAVAEAGGKYWSGRAIGVHSTGQLLVSSAAPSVLGAGLAATGYGWLFGSVAILPLLAAWTLPVRNEESRIAAEPGGLPA